MRAPPADRDPEYVLQGLGGPREREPHRALARPVVGEDGPGAGQHLLTGADLSLLDVIGEPGEESAAAVGAEVAGLAFGGGPGEEAEGVGHGSPSGYGGFDER